MKAAVRPRWTARHLASLFRSTAQPQLTAWSVLIALVAATGVSLLRQPGAGALNTIWAEDGTIFLTDAYRPGFWDELWSPYAGYVHVVPRVLAELAALFPVSWAAAVLATEAAVLTAAMAVLVFSLSSTHIQGTVGRVVAAAPVVVLPFGQGDLLNAIANLHWPALYVTFWVLLWKPARAPGVALAAVILGLTAGSDVLVVLFVPLAVLRILSVPGPRGWVPAAGLFTGLVAQFLVRWVNEAPRDLAPELDPLRLAGGVVGRLVPLSIMGERWAGEPGPTALFLLTAGVAWLTVVSVAVASAGGPTDRVTFASVAVAHAVVLYVVPSVATGVFTPRYAAAPAMLLLAAGAALLGPGARLPRGSRAVAVITCGLLLTVAAVNLRVHNQRADGPSWSTSAGKASQQCRGDLRRTELPISPLGWTVQMPCRVARP